MCTVYCVVNCVYTVLIHACMYTVHVCILYTVSCTVCILCSCILCSSSCALWLIFVPGVRNPRVFRCAALDRRGCLPIGQPKVWPLINQSQSGGGDRPVGGASTASKQETTSLSARRWAFEWKAELWLDNGLLEAYVNEGKAILTAWNPGLYVPAHGQGPNASVWTKGATAEFALQWSAVGTATFRDADDRAYSPRSYRYNRRQ